MRDPPSSDELAVLPTAPDDGTATSTGGEPAPGQRIGRFVVRDLLGRGGMGLVLSAYDPQLERRVAIKLVKPGGGSTGAEVRARLLREARAMARLRHPNIVSVFEAGEHGGQVYVAMEEVEGGNLRAAIRRIEDSGGDWRRIVSMFAEAGKGLAAAHAAGMVHRDFKPDNVLIGLHGRVVVGDFGIVGRTGVKGPGTGDDVHLFSEQLTRADEVVGTPVYMAPEQHSGEPVDERADQFSFCVALYEALYGQLPFAGDTRETYVESIHRGAVRSPPPGRRVPEWLHKLIVRGLSADRADRFASMEDLLVELGADPARTRRLGGVERMALIGGLSAFVFVWAASVVGFHIELTYALHYATDLGFLGLVAGLGWHARHAIARSEFNRRVLVFFASASFAVLLLVVGGQLLGFSADSVGALHLLVIGTAALFAVYLFGRRAIFVPMGYLGGFLVAAARPDQLLPVLLAAHTIGALTAIAVFRNKPRKRRTSRDFDGPQASAP